MKTSTTVLIVVIAVMGLIYFHKNKSLIVTPKEDDIGLHMDNGTMPIEENFGVVLKTKVSNIKEAPIYNKTKRLKQYIKQSILNGEIPHFDSSADLETINQAYIDVYKELGGTSTETEKDLWKAIRKKAKEKGELVKETKLK